MTRSGTMKAAVLTGLRKIEIVETPTPDLVDPQGVLLRTEVVGVCGSDVHYFTEGKIGDQVVQYPYRVGHEFSATILEVGSEVSSLQPGDRVAVDPAIHCGKCSQCLAGRANTCSNLSFLGCPGQIEGCLAEYMVMPAQCCYPIPERLTLEEAAIVEPLSIGIYAVTLAGPIAGQAVGILGSGPIGLSVLLPALDGGASNLYVTDKIEERLQVARGAGAAATANPLRQNVVGDILLREPEGLDVVFECCGQQEALDQALQLLKPGGRLMIVGIPAEDRVSFNVDAMRRKEIKIFNVRRQNECTVPAIDFIARGNQVDFMVTHEFPLDQSQEAFELVSSYRDGVVKAFIRPGR